MRAYAKQRPVTLVLLVSTQNYKGKFRTYCANLGELDYLDQIVIGIDRANQQEYAHALDFL